MKLLAVSRLMQTKAQLCRHVFRASSTASTTSLKDRLRVLVPEKRIEVQEFRKEYGDAKIGEVTVNMAYGGMRGIKGLVTETSVLDPVEGIRFRGYSIPECQKLLPTAIDGGEPLPEGLFWLLMTGEIPTKEQATFISREFASRAELPQHIVMMLNNFPEDLHPMSQFSAALTALNSESKFAKAYADGTKKTEYWEYIYEDAMDLLAKLPVIAAVIYRNLYRDGRVAPLNPEGDWAMNLSTMLGYDDPTFIELMRLYLMLHTDHEGGNVSAHTCHLVGSALSDPYLSFAAALNGLSGPLHGLANQEVLLFVMKLVDDIGYDVNKQQIEDYCHETLKTGVIPGYGHAVLRKTDPRYTCQREFALKHMPEDPMFKVVSLLYEVVPDLLGKLGKVQNPWPNVDAHSGVNLQHFGLTEMGFYTVLFGVSRAMGCMSSLLWDRALGLPIERPKSMSTEGLKKLLIK